MIAPEAENAPVDGTTAARFGALRRVPGDGGANVGEMRLKGSNFRGVVAAVRRLRGGAAFDRCVAETTGELQEALRYGSIVSSGWYPLAWYRDLLGAIQRGLATTPDFARVVAREAVKEDFQTLYRVLSWVIAPETLLANSLRMFRMYYDAGTFEIRERRSGMACGDFRECHGFSKLVWLDVIGGCEAALESAGAENLRFRIVRGGGDQASEMTVEFRWTRKA